MKCTPVDQDTLRQLAAHTSDNPLLSVYLRTTSQPDEIQKNRIRFKNARRDALRQLIDAGVEEDAASQIVKPLSHPDSELWSHRGHGVALFVNGSNTTCLRMLHSVPDFVLAAEHYHLKPTFVALRYESPYFVLAISQNDVSLFIGDGSGLERVALDESVPKSLADSSGRELSESHLQHHSGDRGTGEAIFHGQGAGKDDTDAELEAFLRDTDRRLRAQHLDGSALVLAGVTDVVARFRRLSNYAALVDEEISGNVEHMSISELHARTWPIIEHRCHRRRDAELEQLIDRATARPVTTDLANTVVAALDGRIARLFVAVDRERWGSLNSESREMTARTERGPTDNDLLDRAAANAYLGGAEVWPVPKSDLPGDSDSIALLRY